MITKTEFNAMAIRTNKEGFGTTVMNRVFKKRNKRQFVKDYIKSLNTEKLEDKAQEEYKMNLMISEYEEEFDTDAEMITSVGNHYDNVVVGTEVPEGTFRVRTGFFVKMYTAKVNYTFKNELRGETVLIVVPRVQMF